VQLIAPMT